ncbi:XopAP family type III secretion system effector, partial [Paracidovorax anthurii]
APSPLASTQPSARIGPSGPLASPAREAPAAGPRSALLVPGVPLPARAGGGAASALRLGAGRARAPVPVVRAGARGLPPIDPARVDLGRALVHVDLPARPAGAARLQRGAPAPQSLDRMRREVLECMRACAGHAYTVDPREIPAVGGLAFDEAWSTPSLRCWRGGHPEATALVLAFSGTRMDDRKDLLCDLSSQWSLPHANPLGQDLPSLGTVGMGWQERWRSEARTLRADGFLLAALLSAQAAEARDAGRLLSVSVVGHSLGAVVATLAGADIASFLRRHGAAGQVSAYAFNPPRLGPAGIGDRYREALESGEAPEMRFALRQLARQGDPIQSMPFNMHHPGWAARAGTTTTDRAPPADADAERGAHLATYTDRLSSPWNPAENHELPPWESSILGDISERELRSLFTGSPARKNEGRNAFTSLSMLNGLLSK